MSRQDILMDPAYGEVETYGNLAGKTFYAFALTDAVEGADNDTFRYGEITVPQGFVPASSDVRGIRVHIPYTPDPRRLMVRFRRESGSGGVEYLRNPATGRQWFPVLAEQDGNRTAIALSMFCTVNAEGIYNLQPRDDCLVLYSGTETDFGIGRAKAQNEAFLLKAAAGNLYGHPTTGVGLIDFLHSNLENNGLAAKLQAEFASDKVIIKNAYMDSETGELLLETQEKEDADG